MKTQAYFENIRSQIIRELENSKNSIIIAVAWFTDAELFNTLYLKAKQGVTVELIIMNDEINNNSGIIYSDLQAVGAKVWMVGNNKESAILMHNKFCILDNQTVINGSYNWTNKAQRNYESITVIEDLDLALQFSDEFRSLKEKYFGTDIEDTLINYTKLCIRLETLKNLILLEDNEDIIYQLNKLKKEIKTSKDNQISVIFKVIDLVSRQNYGEAVMLINEFINRFQSLTIYVDSEIHALKLEMRALELQISSLDDEKAELEKLIHNFEVRHNHELGELIIKILLLRKEKLKQEADNNEQKENEFKEAKNDYEEYYNQYQNTKNEIILDLDEDQKKELKIIYRNASKLCHPDVVDEKFKNEAEQLFKELNDANASNDLKRVNEIFETLKQGIFKSHSQTISEKEQILKIVTKLRMKRNQLDEIVNNIKSSETFKTVSSIQNWDTYFEEVKEQLKSELGKLNMQID
ncbi:MAG: phospholipase D-like domain-containing protein [Bacteroidota bacterium]